MTAVCAVQQERMPTGIPGLDPLLGGGIRAKSINLIAGGAGTGKSIFCMQFLVNGIAHGQNAVYVSFEEDEPTLLEDMACFGWDLSRLIREEKLVILHYTHQQVEHVLEAGGGIIRDTIEAIDAKLVVIDSLTAFTLLHDTEHEQRRALLALFDNLRKWGVTAFVTSQREEDEGRPESDVLVFETDAVIAIYSTHQRRKRAHALEVLKVRGSSHSTDIHPLTISSKGVSVQARPLR